MCIHSNGSHVWGVPCDVSHSKHVFFFTSHTVTLRGWMGLMKGLQNSFNLLTSKAQIGKPLPLPVFPNRPKQHCFTHTHREKGFQTLCHNRNSKYLTLSYMTVLIIDMRKETIATQTPGIRVSVPMATKRVAVGGFLSVPIDWPLTPNPCTAL